MKIIIQEPFYVQMLMLDVILSIIECSAIITKEIDITNNNVPIEKILPIPIYWLDKKLKENGMLKSKECKISY